ncbi:MAG TPA: trehalase family glycosidase [Acidimicrobiales bacterium]|nr:trehalase family glycosidase [Acidimicrobiales bacterium]
MAADGLYDDGFREALYRSALTENIHPPEGVFAHPWISPGPLYRTIGGQWIWDACFSGLAVAKVGGRPDVAKGFVENLAAVVEPAGPDAGMILHAADSAGKNPALIEGTSQTPLVALLALEAHRLEPDAAFVERVYPALAGNVRWWRSPRRDVDQDGLSEFAGPGWRAALHESGIDVGPNKELLYFDPPAAGADGLVHDQVADVVLNAALVSECESLAELAEVIGHADDAVEWRAEAEAISRAMRARMWDDDIGAFLPCLRADVVATQPRLHRVTPLVLAPLWAGVATADQAARTIALVRGVPRQFPTAEGVMRIRLGSDAELYRGHQVVTDGLCPPGFQGVPAGVQPGDVEMVGDGWRAATGPVFRCEWPDDRNVATVWFARLAVEIVLAPGSGAVVGEIVDGRGRVFPFDGGGAVFGEVSGPPGDRVPRGLRSVEVRAAGAGSPPACVREVRVSYVRPERAGLLSPYGIRSAHPLDGKYPAPGAPTHFWSGTVWAPFVWFACHAFRRYGEESLAVLLAERYCHAVRRAHGLGAESPEHLSAETGVGMGAPNVAWTGAVALLLESDFLRS